MIGVDGAANVPPWRLYTMEPVLPYFGESIMGVVGDLESHGPDDGVLVQIYDECLEGLVADSLTCDCNAILVRSRERIILEGLGVLFGLHGGNIHPGEASPGQGYKYGQNHSPFPVERYIPCARLLVANGVGKITFMSSDSIKASALEGQGIEVIGNA